MQDASRIGRTCLWKSGATGTGFSTFTEIDFSAGAGGVSSALILELLSENKLNELMENNIIPRI
jgi:hypothetical protein